MTQDSDGDGIPDHEDLNPNFNEESLSLGDHLENINYQVDQISDGIDTLMAGLSCGFGGGSTNNSPMNWAPLAPG